MNEFFLFLKSFFNMLIKCEGVTVENLILNLHKKLLVLDEGQWLFRADLNFLEKKSLRKLLNSSSKSIIRSFLEVYVLLLVRERRILFNFHGTLI